MVEMEDKNELNKYYVLDENYNNYDYREDDEKDNQRDAFYAMHNDIDDIYENDKYDPFGIISNKVPIFKRMYIFNIKNFFQNTINFWNTFLYIMSFTNS